MNKEERQAMLVEKFRSMSAYEDALRASGIRYIAGMDEVGRGPLAGPVVAAAVVLPQNELFLGIDDSKKLSAKKRELFYEQISEKAVSFGIGVIESSLIDKVNILEATKMAMMEALRECELGMRDKIEHVLIDAITLKDISMKQTAIIKGDTLSVSIAAASILAKVTRDRMMEGYDAIYPGYGFLTNKGYGTAAHYEGLREKGLTEIHRRSFLKEFS